MPYLLGSRRALLYGSGNIPVISDPGSPEFLFDGSNTDGLGTHNASLAHGALLSTVTNLGSAGVHGTNAQASNYWPKLKKRSLGVGNSEDTLLFDRNMGDYLQLVGSASSLAAIHQTGIFECTFEFITYIYGQNQTIFAATDTGSNQGMGIQINSTGFLHPFFGKTGTLNANLTATLRCRPGRHHVVCVRGDGTNLYVSLDGSAEQSTPIINLPLGSGSAAFDYHLGVAPHAGGVRSAFCGEIGRFDLRLTPRADANARAAAIASWMYRFQL